MKHLLWFPLGCCLVLAFVCSGVGAITARAQISGQYRFATFAGPPAGLVVLLSPEGLARDMGGNLYVSDSRNHVIRKLAPDGTASVFAGAVGTAGTTDGPVTSALLSVPTGLRFDGAGSLYFI